MTIDSDEQVVLSSSPVPVGDGVTLEDLEAASAIQGANPFVGLSVTQTLMAGGRWAGAAARKPPVVASGALRWGSEQLKVVAGTSTVTPDPKDKRFADPAWKNPLWRRLAQSYLVSCDALLGSVDEVGLDPKSADRARFALGQMAAATAPTNYLVSNPLALKTAVRTRGGSLVAGCRQAVHDARHNGGMPSQVDTRPFRVGETVAVTPGAVIHRTEMYELIEYAPSTRRVRARPTVVIPPQVNRYYFLDLAPGRSFVEHAVGQGLQTFLISWRNPTPEHRGWGLDEYVEACAEALRIAVEVTGADRANVTGFCSGGMTESALLSHLAATGDDLVASATMAVTMVDTAVESTLNMFVSKRSVRTSLAKSQRKGVLEGRSLSRVFAWVRPNDLVWNYVINNYLLGADPPAFDVLAWNSDSTNMAAKLHADFLEMWVDNALMSPGATSVLGRPLDLTRVTTDVYAVGALTDHLVPWQSAYAATRAFGGDVRYVLSNSGHIQALINPPGNPKASFYVGDTTPTDALEWLNAASKRTGSWWQDWAEWVLGRSGDEVARRKSPGGAGFPVVCPAPGRYVLG